MPHFGLMNPAALGPEEAAFRRARLHVRAGKRRLRQGKIAAGMVTLWDAFTHALDWYVASPGRVEKLQIEDGEDLKDDSVVFAVLQKSGVVSDTFSFGEFEAPLEQALEEGDVGCMEGFEHGRYVERLEAFMTDLGVMPFDEGSLPPEDPATF